LLGIQSSCPFLAASEALGDVLGTLARGPIGRQGPEAHPVKDILRVGVLRPPEWVAIAIKPLHAVPPEGAE
jgi:hypothetical protein